MQGVPVDMTTYDPDCGVKVNAKDDSLTARWETPEGITVLTLDVSGQGALVRSIAVGLGDSEPVVVLRDANPVTVLTVGERDLKKRGGWTIFFDRVDRKPSESGLLNLKLKSATVRSVGRRCFVEFDRLEGDAFSGKLRFTLYAGCDRFMCRRSSKHRRMRVRCFIMPA